MKHQKADGKAMQAEYFERIKSRLNNGESLVEVTSELLDVSDDSAYRRIRGETLLNINELKVLSEQFELSLDEIVLNSNDGIYF